MRAPTRIFLAFGFALGLAHSPFALAGGRVVSSTSTASTSASLADTTDQMIIKLRDPSTPDVHKKLSDLGTWAGTPMTQLRAMSNGAYVTHLSQRLNHADARQLAKRIAADPAVAFVEPDYRVYPQRVPNDPLYAQQWHYYEAAGGINLPKAWDLTTGAASVVVAVIDTGILPHADLAGRTVPGYDFITDITTANDGDARDADPSDPGDYGCTSTSTSSWHGTHVAGTIGAASDNGLGVAGVNWVSKIQPVRVLGRCGGYTSDIVDGMRWAAGIAVPGAPVNATPARVENLSLGGSGTCSASFQSAVNDVIARGTIVVVAGGNSNDDAANFQPASCAGVIAVAATNRNGSRASFSNFGPKIAISAPGGDGILSTLNTGTTTPLADSYAYYQGTSMSTPHVAGVVSLMLSVNPALTPAQVLTQLQATARAFPTGITNACTTALCGAGIVDAGAAVAAVMPPVTTVRTNFAASSKGSVATASSTYSASFPASGANDGEHRGLNWGAGGGWNDANAGVYPDWLMVDFGTARTIDEIDVFTVQDNYAAPVEPTASQTFGLYGITNFEVQYWTGSAWVAVPGGTVVGNNKVWNKFTFSPITTNLVRVYITGSLASYSRIAEIEAYGNALVTTPATPTNVALASNGGSVVTSSSYSASFPASSANDGDRRGLNWGAGGGWNDGTLNAYPDWLQVNFSGVKTINEIDVFTVQDNYNAPSVPTDTMIFSLYGITDFDVQYWNGSNWVTVPAGTVTANNKVWRKFSFAALATNSIRINVNNALASFSRIAEVEAYAP